VRYTLCDSNEKDITSIQEDTVKKQAAIIGFGGMGQRHYSAYTSLGVDIVAIADLDTEKVKKILPDFEGDRIYGDYKDLLRCEKGNLDILSVVTNGPTHAEVTCQGSEAGIPNILCEKPMATNLSDAGRVIEICSRNNTRLAVNHIRRWSSNYARIKELIGARRIGEIRHLYFNCGSTGLGNFAIHFFDTARYISGSEPEWAIGFLDPTGTPNPRGSCFSDPGGYGIIKFRNGVRFFVDTSEDTGVQYTFQIVGSRGRIIIDELNDSWLIRARSESDKDVPFTRYGTDMPELSFRSAGKFDIVRLTSLAMQELLNGGPISSTGIDGLKSLEMVIGIHLSDHCGNRSISFPISGTGREIDVKIA